MWYNRQSHKPNRRKATRPTQKLTKGPKLEKIGKVSLG